MKHIRAALYKAVRPQFFITLAALAALCVGMLWPIMPRSNQRGDDGQPYGRRTDRRTGKPSWLVQAQPVVDCAVRPCLALSFDDGPHSTVTPQILATLKRHQVHATFFVIGSHVPGNEKLLRQMYQDGHEIGNHSWSHPDLTALSIDQLQMQVYRTQQVVTDAGVPAPTLFRPPYGAVNAVVQAHVPLTFAMWNVDPEDWRQKTPKDIIDRIEANVRPGRVVDLHDIHQPMADALDQLLNDLAPHYQFVTFSQLFNLMPGQRGIYYGR